MGSGIAHVSALAGYNVLLYDVSPERIEKGIATDQRQHGAPGRLAASSTRSGAQARAWRASGGADHGTTSPAPIW